MYALFKSTNKLALFSLELLNLFRTNMRLFVVAIFLALTFSVPIITAQTTTTPVINCAVGTTWVINYIEFQCYTNATVSRGVKPIGIIA